MILNFCLKCGRWLPALEFRPRADKATRFPYCRECHDATVKWSQLKRRHEAGAKPHYQQLPQDGVGKCRDCGKETLQLKGVNGYLCRECKRGRERKYNASRKKK